MHFCGNPSGNWLPHYHFNETNLPQATLARSYIIPCLCTGCINHCQGKSKEIGNIATTPRSNNGEEGQGQAIDDRKETNKSCVVKTEYVHCCSTWPLTKHIGVANEGQLTRSDRGKHGLVPIT